MDGSKISVANIFLFQKPLEIGDSDHYSAKIPPILRRLPPHTAQLSTAAGHTIHTNNESAVLQEPAGSSSVLQFIAASSVSTETGELSKKVGTLAPMGGVIYFVPISDLHCAFVECMSTEFSQKENGREVA
jgi:hypothetical protein